MNIILLIGLAICEIFFAGMILWELYCLLRWLDRRVFTPLLSKVNDFVLKVYAYHVIEGWLLWERRKEESDGGDGIAGPPAE